MPGESERDPTTRLQDPSYLSQPRHGIRPDLHGVDGQRAIEERVFKRQLLHKTLPEVDAISFNRLRIPNSGLLDHFLGLVRAVTDPETTTNLSFPVPNNFQTGEFLLRVQVDGAESPLEVDTNPASPTFNQYTGPKVTIT
jgi:hypothetical protein